MKHKGPERGKVTLAEAFKKLHAAAYGPIQYAVFITGYSEKAVHVLEQLRDFGPLSMGEMGEMLRLSPPQATVFADAMVERELITRRAGENDRRKVYIDITDQGLDVLERFNEIIANMLDHVVANIPQGQIGEVTRSIETLLKAIEKATLDFIEDGGFGRHRH